ncbi:MAG: hypothetical protein HUK21_04765 [Fibrobacteraceae bacterium]|mgnify:FL=1|nr:hypothetical protein [Fibrobacteraceae bacterium]
MNKFKTILALSALAFLQACSSDDSTSASDGFTLDFTEIPQSCTVNTTENAVYMTTAYKNWSKSEIDTFDGNFIHTTQTFIGLTTADEKFICNSIKELEELGKIQNVICNGNTITSSTSLKGCNLTVDLIKTFYEETCNKAMSGEQSTSLDDLFNSTSASDGFTLDFTEIPQSCTVNTTENTLYLTIALKNWTWSETDVLDGNVTHITQTFTGLTKTEEEFFCNKEKGIEEEFNVVCNGNVITSDVSITESQKTEYVQEIYNVICEKLLSGSLTLEDFINLM